MRQPVHALLIVLGGLAAGCGADVADVADTASALAPSFTYSAIDFPNATRTIVLGLNDRGHYVGLFVDVTTRRPHAMLFDGQTLSALDPGGIVGNAARSRAYAINNAGGIVGSYSDSAGILHGYLFSQGSVTTIDHPSGQPTEVYGINDHGEMIGVSYDADDNAHGFALERGVFRDLDLPGSFSTVPLSINDRGVIVGEVIDVAGTVGHGYRQSRSGHVMRYDAPQAPADSTYFISINDRGQILGGYFDAAFNAYNFVLDHGVAEPFDLPASFGASSVTAQTLNNAGAIVGSYVDAAGVTHGFLATRCGP